MRLLAVGLIAATVLGCTAGAWAAELPEHLTGHGGPVKGITVAPSGDRVATASFDYSVIVRSWPSGVEQVILYGHDAAANAVAFTPDGHRMVTVGDDGLVLVWSTDGSGERRQPLARLTGHQGKILQVDVSRDGRLAATASWDGKVGLWSLDPPAPLTMLEGHQGPVNAVALSDDGTQLYSAGYDGTVRLWSVAERRELRTLVRHGFGINVIAVDEAAGQLTYGALDGGMRVVDLASGEVRTGFEHDRTPILALAESHDGRRIAFGDGHGVVTVVDTVLGQVSQDFPAARGPIWALAFGPRDESLLVGGLGSTVAVWPLDPLRRPAEVATRTRAGGGTMTNGERQFERKCRVCHTLSRDTARRAGPTLHGLMGRRAGTVDGYPYSGALTGIDLIWTAETVDQLFEQGPDNFLPGTKMPLQKMTNARDRADLIEYLKSATR
ncbi:c-type cytochrome [Thalassobaculum sp.]|uniref:c-type cytochrome n=1 Tax=Thalassobaculum sp. TaxID=2022740 RepID=UPI0032EE08B0